MPDEYSTIDPSTEVDIPDDVKALIEAARRNYFASESGVSSKSKPPVPPPPKKEPPKQPEVVPPQPPPRPEPVQQKEAYPRKQESPRPDPASSSGVMKPKPSSPPPTPAAPPRSEVPKKQELPKQEPTPRPAPPSSVRPTATGLNPDILLLSVKAKELYHDGIPPSTLLKLLQENKLFVDAIRVAAHTVSRRDAVAWSCRWAKKCAILSRNIREELAVKATETWLQQQTEESRRAAKTAADQATLQTPAGLAAMAVFWSGGSLTGPDMPAVAPDETLCARGAAAALLLTIARLDPSKTEDNLLECLQDGVGKPG